MGTLGYFILFGVIFFFGKFIYDSYLTDNTEKGWEGYQRNKSKKAIQPEEILNQSSLFLQEGKANLDKELYQEALSCFNQAIELVVGNRINATKLYNGYYLRSMAHLGLNDFNNCIKDLRKCIEVNPKFLDGLITLTKVYLSKEDLVNAKEIIDIITVGYYADFYGVVTDTQYIDISQIKDKYYNCIGL